MTNFRAKLNKHLFPPSIHNALLHGSFEIFFLHSVGLGDVLASEAVAALLVILALESELLELGGWGGGEPGAGEPAGGHQLLVSRVTGVTSLRGRGQLARTPEMTRGYSRDSHYQLISYYMAIKCLDLSFNDKNPARIISNAIPFHRRGGCLGAGGPGDARSKIK